MRLSKRLLLAVGVSVVMLMLAGCPSQVTVAELQSRPDRYTNKEVVVTGTVTEGFGLLGQGAYQVDDGTGKIWVLANGFGVPTKGARVGVQGRFVNGVELGGRSFANALSQTHTPHY
jgi:hypothetical protein